MQMLINVTPSIISILDRAHFYNAKKTLFNHIKNFPIDNALFRHHLFINCKHIKKKYHSRLLYLITTKFIFFF